MEFISVQGNKKEFPNLGLLLSLEKEYPRMFVKVMLDFEEVKSMRETLDENGKPIKLSWEETLKKYYINNAYIGVTKEDKDIAELYASKGISQEIFDSAKELRSEAKAKNVPEHLLGKEIKEETILESIERIREQTAKELMDCGQIIEELYDKQFTYEWLSKNDPHNAIMGLFCTCCGSITSDAYGRYIAESSVTAHDVQNLVVRNSNGDIIAKGTMYLNKKKGYGVINDFEVNSNYRKHETSEAGIYMEEEGSKEATQREMIFKAFQRGIQAFVNEYDEQNPDSPIKQINVGMGYNRLKKQVQRFEEDTKNLTVPSEYNFVDAMEHEQYILYDRKSKILENGGSER